MVLSNNNKERAMRNIQQILLAALLGGLSTGVTAETLDIQVAACASEELFDEMAGYMNKKDKNGMLQLIVTGQCTLLDAGTQVSIIKRGYPTVIRYAGQKFYTYF
jgi:hypothetical protein